MCFCLVSFFFAKVKIFSFWPKTMDYSQAFLPKLSSFFVLLLLLAGKCYEAETCAILLPFRCAFAWYPFLPKSNFSVSGRKPSSIVRRLPKLSSFFVLLLLLAGRCYEAKIYTILLPFRCAFAWYPLFFTKVKILSFWPKTMDRDQTLDLSRCMYYYR